MANISDVAALAGVSRQTVSRVLNDEDTVTPATRSRVDDAIRRLNYRPSAAARALVTRRTRTIGVVATGAALYGPSSTMLAFNEAARAEGYRVVTATLGAADRAAVLDAIDVLIGQDVEALVLIATDYAALDAVAGLELAIPLVTAESSGRAGYRIGARLTDRIERAEVTAVFCANDQMAAGLVHALADRGIRVPAQVSIAGFDDVPEAAHFLPPLTTVRQDFVELGARMMATLVSALQGRASPHRAQATPELVVRSSTGRVPRRR